MVQEEYINFETAKLLKDKGFDEICYLGYNVNGAYFPTSNRSNSQIIQPDFCFICCPTQQHVMRWMREAHNLFIEIQCYSVDNDFNYSYVVYRQLKNLRGKEYGIGKHSYLRKEKGKSQFRSYEEACEEAIKYCLINLI